MTSSSALNGVSSVLLECRRLGNACVNTSTDKREISTMNSLRRPHGDTRSVSPPRDSRVAMRRPWQQARSLPPAPPGHYLIRKKSRGPAASLLPSSRLASGIPPSLSHPPAAEAAQIIHDISKADPLRLHEHPISLAWRLLCRRGRPLWLGAPPSCSFQNPRPPPTQAQSKGCTHHGFCVCFL